MKNFLIAMLLGVVCLATAIAAQAQTGPTPTPAQTETKAEDETNLETQLFLIVGSNQEVGDSKLPASLDQVVKQMRAALPSRKRSLPQSYGASGASRSQTAHSREIDQERRHTGANAQCNSRKPPRRKG